jgi:predicted nucleic acid-binding protein
VGGGAGGAGGHSLKYLLDSVILIDHFRGHGVASRWLADHGRDSALSVITRAEVLAGFDARDAASATGLLDRFPTLGIDRPIADLAAALRREHRWKMPDALQAALASYHGLTLATRNTRDFSPERHGFVVVPYVLEVK